MNGCLNVLWHFPFFGFIFAFFYALFGALLCCTVIFYPVGLGFFRIARFLLSPFSSALVSRKDLDLVRPQERSTAAAAYSTLISVLYIPFGLVAAAGAVCAMVAEFVSIFGIPCGIVWFKALPSIFMPVDKVCVPRAVAEEIARLKAGQTVDRFRGGNGPAEAAIPAAAVPAEPEARVYSDVPEVRTFDEERLRGIVADPAMYRAELVEQCRRELEIRAAAAALMPRVKEYDDAQLREILASPQMYSEELSYCAQQEDAERRRLVAERQAREAEQARLEREQAAKEAAERRAAEWKKKRPYYIAAAVVLTLAVAGASYYGYWENQRFLRQEQERLERERIAEEQRRIAQEERRAAEHAEEQRRAAEQRKAAEQQRERQRIAAEQAAAEKKAAEQRRRAEMLERNSKGIYQVGDMWGDSQGVVCSVDASGRSGVVVSIAEERMTGPMAQKKVPGWKLPSEKDLVSIFRHRTTINQTLRQAGCAVISTDCYWGDVAKPGYLWRISMSNGTIEKKLLAKKLVDGKYVEEECLVRWVRYF